MLEQYIRGTLFSKTARREAHEPGSVFDLGSMVKHHEPRLLYHERPLQVNLTARCLHARPAQKQLGLIFGQGGGI